jgi:hypothetical protein
VEIAPSIHAEDRRNPSNLHCFQLVTRSEPSRGAKCTHWLKMHQLRAL